MNDNFKNILNKHEKDDQKNMNQKSAFMLIMLEEYENGKEIIEEAKKQNLSMKDFLYDKYIDFPIVPIRRSNKFSMKKHTLSQIPYFHKHNYYELIYVHKGRCVQKFKDNSIEEIVLLEKQAMLLPPNTVHLIEKIEQRDIVFKVVIPANLFNITGKMILNDSLANSARKNKLLSNKSQANELSLYETLINCEQSNKSQINELSNKIQIFDDVNENAEFILLKLLNANTDNEIFKDLSIQSNLTLLFVELVRTKKPDNWIEYLLNDYFENNIQTANLADFAIMQNYNPSYISRDIKNQTGKTFSELLTNYRMAYAKNLLSTTKFSIEIISDMVGYANSSGFYKQWYNNFGISPAAFRKLNK